MPIGAEPTPDHCNRLMEQGAEFWKYHYRQVGRPARVVVQLVGPPEDQVIAWKDHGEPSFAASVAVADVIDVRKGPHSRTFAENQAHTINPSMCFSIYTRGRTLDLEAVHPEDLKVWFSGIKHRLQTAPSGAKDDVRYTEINSRTKEEWHYDGGRMVQHFHHPDGKGVRGDFHTELLEDLERHLEIAGHQDPLDSIEEWLAMKRRTSRALGPPPEPLDVDQWFKHQPPAAVGPAVVAAPAPAPAIDDFDRGYRAGCAAAAPGPVYGAGR